MELSHSDHNWDNIYIVMNMEPNFFTWWDIDSDPDLDPDLDLDLDDTSVETFLYDFDTMKWIDRNSPEQLMKKFRKVDLDGDDVCPICMDQMHAATSLESPCNHSFCASCIKEWLKRSDLCPICKHSFSHDDHKKTT